MATQNNLDIKSSKAKVYAITSGKGGVGKTSLAVNLSVILSKASMRVLLIDADMGLANVDLMTGVLAPHTIEEVINGKASIFDALVEGPEGLTILPASSGVGHILEVGQESEALFLKELLKLEHAFDIIFIDTGAGISANVIDFVFMAEEVIVIMTPEPTAFADAYAMVKLVATQKPDMKISIVVNIVKSADEGNHIFTKFNEIVERFLGRSVIFRGSIFSDASVSQAVMRQVPLALYAGSSPAVQSMKNIAKNVLGIKTAKKRTIFNR